jgi:hypothetical protein
MMLFRFKRHMMREIVCRSSTARVADMTGQRTNFFGWLKTWVPKWASKPPPRRRIYDFEFPDEFEGAALTEVRYHGSSRPGLGYSVGYTKVPTQTTIYIYDELKDVIPGNPDDPSIIAEMETAKNEVLEAWRAGIFSEFSAKENFALFSDNGRKLMRCWWYTFSYRQAPELKGASILCVGAAKNKFIKLRISSAGEEVWAFKDALDSARAWSRFFWPQPT